MGTNDYTLLVLRTSVSPTLRHLNLLAVREPKTTETGPSRVASTEVVCLVNLVQVFDILLSQIYDFGVACARMSTLA